MLTSTHRSGRQRYNLAIKQKGQLHAAVLGMAMEAAEQHFKVVHTQFTTVLPVHGGKAEAGWNHWSEMVQPWNGADVLATLLSSSEIGEIQTCIDCEDPGNGLG